MATVPTQIRIDEATKIKAGELLEGLGLTISDAVNIFLKQVILHGGIPFSISYPDTAENLKPEVLEAMEEAKKLSRDPGTKRYGSFAEALKDLDL